MKTVIPPPPPPLSTLMSKPALLIFIIPSTTLDHHRTGVIWFAVWLTPFSGTLEILLLTQTTKHIDNTATVQSQNLPVNITIRIENLFLLKSIAGTLKSPDNDLRVLKAGLCC